MRKTKNTILLLLTALIWGSAFVAQSVGMDYVGPFTFNSVRCLIGGLVLLPCIFFFKRFGIGDGGWEEDSRYLTQKIMENGGRVAAWFLTHPHGDHAGALEKILRDKPEGITIEKIYCSLADPQWYRTYAPDDPGIADRLLERFQTLPEGMVDIQIGKGDCFRIDDVTVTVMNDRGTCRENAVNNSCIVFKLQIKKQSLLLLGDLACQGGQELLRDCGPSELRADIVQMAHHGQGGVGKTVYEAIAPEICLWPTPEWLWNNDNGNGKGSGPWSTLETRKWMEELGVKDNLCTKDGMVHMYFR